MKTVSNLPTILAVNDEPDVLELLTVLLEREGYRVITASNGERALELAFRAEPDVVISDVVMPLIDGVELCRRLKQDPRTAHVPVMLASALRTAENDSVNGLSAGADDYLDLPFRRQELLVKVARLTERHRVERHYREIVEQAADIIFTRDMQGYITSINEAGARFMGRPATALVGAHLSELIDPATATKEIARHIEYARQNSDEPLRMVHPAVNAQGTARYLEAITTVVRDADGQATGVRGVVRDITERAQAENALRESEERYRQMFEKNRAIKLLIDPETSAIVDANPAACDFYGYSLEEFRTKHISDINMMSEAEIAEALQRVANEERSYFQFRHRLASGELRDVEVHSSPVNLGGRKILYSNIHDVTESKRAEMALRASDERYRDLFENANDLIYTHDLEGNFTSLNKAGERITGYTRAEALKMNISQVVVPEQLEKARGMIARKTEEAVSTVYELDIVAKDGHGVALEVSTRLIYEHGVPIGVQGIGRDVTERKRVESQLQASEVELRALFAAMTDVILVLDGEGRYRKIAPSNPSLLYKPSEELIGKTLHEVFPMEQADLFLDCIRRALKMGHPVNVEYSLMLNGVEHFFDATVSPSQEDAVVWVARDITKRKRAEQALTQQVRREALINRISQAVRGTLDSTEVFRTAVRELGTHLKVDRCSLFINDASAGRLRNMAEYHAPGVLPVGRDFDAIQLGDLIAGVSQHGALAFDNVATDERISHIYQKVLRPMSVRSIMYVAIKVGNETPAAFALTTTRSLHHWREEEIELAKAVADQTGLAIRQAELFQKADATSTREALINRLGVAIRASLTLNEVLQTATRELGRALNASRVHLYLYDPARSRSPLEHEYLAPHVSSIKHVDVSFDDLIGQRVMRSSQPIVVNDAQKYSGGSPEFSDYTRSQLSPIGVRSEIICPVTVNGRFRAALCIQQTDRARYWTEDEVMLVESVAVRLSTGIAQAELFEMTQRAKKEWETTFNAMSDGIFIFDNAGQLMRVNRAGAAMEDSWPHLLLGRKCCDILRVSGDDNDCIVERTLAEGRSVTMEITPERYNRPLLVTMEPVFESGNKTVGAVCTARDLSELRKVYLMPRERQSLLTNILECVREPIYAIDTSGRFLWCNGATTSAVGYAPEDLIGHHFLEIVYPADREMARENFESALLGETKSYEARYHTHAGEVRYALYDNAPLITDGETTGVLCIARDITEQKQQRQRAAQADKLRALGQLASGVAHDFNNALAAILGRAQLINRQVKDESLARNAAIIQTAAEDAAATVRRIQTFARQSTDREFELLDASGLLRDAMEITRTRWENEARMRGLHYDVELDPGVELYTMGNASELREVFVNLIVNAVDAMPLGGRLKITGESRGESVCLRFKDTGIGMSEDVRERIFEPFYTTKGLQGTGLGLAVSYGIIERHEGQINVESEVGQGTAFEIELPAATIAPSRANERQPQPDSPSLSILVIDDESFVRETLADMLIALDHKVLTASGGREALGLLVAGQEFDLIFTDLSMPEMDGWEVAREIRRRAPDMNIVLVTGYGKGTTPPGGEKNLINGVIGKPFDFDQIIETIAKVTGQGIEVSG